MKIIVEKKNIFTIIIIGNKLNEFANNKNIFTFDQFYSLLQIEKALEQSSHNQYLIKFGQGLSDSQITNIKNEIKSHVISNRFILRGNIAFLKRAHSLLTHKKQIQNIMISEPEKCSNHLYKSFLMLDENCIELSDHSTGQHIQGMVLIEASRQLINAVSEKYLITEKSKEKKGFVLNSLTSKFFEFVFPLEVEFNLKIDKIRFGLNNNFQAEATISIHQQDKLMMEINFHFSAYDEKTLLNIESKMASESVNNYFTQTNSKAIANSHAA